MEIHSVALTDREGIIDVVLSIATNFNQQPPIKVDIEAVHRLDSRTRKILPIIVRFRE